MENKIKEASAFLKQFLDKEIKLGFVLGSGLSDLTESIEVQKTIPYKDIPHFPQSTVAGHKGQLVIGSYKDTPLMLFQGRVHFYEGYTIEDVVFPIRLFKHLGGEEIILTNASGSLEPSWEPGSVMVITDQINFSGQNPLIGKNLDSLGPRFPDMSEPYDKNISKRLFDACNKAGLKTNKGTYIGVLGPSYETPAEIKAFRILGAQAVGMSTVPECIAANHAGLKVGGLSCLTNFASGISNQPLSHKEVQDTSASAKPLLIKAIKNFLDSL